MWNVPVRPRDFADVAVPRWVLGGTLSPITNDHALA
jgi:hypothetical protein